MVDDTKIRRRERDSKTRTRDGDVHRRGRGCWRKKKKRREGVMGHDTIIQRPHRSIGVVDSDGEAGG